MIISFKNQWMVSLQLPLDMLHQPIEQCQELLSCFWINYPYISEFNLLTLQIFKSCWGRMPVFIYVCVGSIILQSWT